MTSPYYRIGRMAVWSIVLLRLCVGWHFFMEGLVKVQEGNFSSKGFLSAAKGPLAPLYQKAIWDYDGTVRLDETKMKEVLASFQKSAVEHYVLNEQQTKDAEALAEKSLSQIEDVFAQWDEDIYKFNNGKERVEAMNRDPMRLFVASLRAQKEKIETDRMNSVRPALSAIDKIVANYRSELDALATDEQRAAKGPVNYLLPGATPFQTDAVDKIVPIFDMAIGICLILGLLVRVASLAAAGFLISVVLSQFPGFEGTAPTYFQAAEAMGCLVLFATDAGRFAGLDFIPWSIWQFSSQSKPASART